MTFFKIPTVYAQTDPNELVGDLEIPKGVDLINQDAGGIGVILFISNMIKFVIILGGIWALINIIFAAFAYLTGGGKADSHTKVKDRFTMSIIGLILMIVAYTVAALVGQIFYGDPNFILNPTLEAIAQPTPTPIP